MPATERRPRARNRFARIPRNQINAFTDRPFAAITGGVRTLKVRMAAAGARVKLTVRAVPVFRGVRA